MDLAVYSTKGIKWQLANSDNRYSQFLQQRFGLNEIVARVISARNIGADDVENFLRPTLRHTLPDPFHLLDMEKAVARIHQAIKNGEKICVFGDYDVDGATSTSLLIRYFAMLGVEVSYYIPDRQKEGYGPNKAAFQKLAEQNIKLIITVDCGTASFDALEFASSIGLEVIVVDHHISSQTLPKCTALINPNRYDETSKYGYLAAVGVAYLLVIAQTSYLRKQGYFENLPEPDLLSLLDLVALGTVCDVVSLEGLNRSFVSQGLKVIKSRKNPGIASLFDIAKLDEPPSSYHLGFIIGPRINAGGRVGQSDLGTQILASNDNFQIGILAQRLDTHNSERKAIESQILEEAFNRAETIDDEVILLASKVWHIGVIGIVAGRLKEKYNKVTCIGSIDATGQVKASCRSIKGFDVGAAIITAKQLGLVSEGGGHAMAAGFTTHENKLPELQKFLNDRFANCQEAEREMIRNFDGYISTSAVNANLIQQLEQLGPFGQNNAEPRFMINDAVVISHRIVGENHISCFVKNDMSSHASIKATAFRAVGSEFGEALMSGPKKIQLIGYMKINFWQGRNTPEFIIEDAIL